MKQRIREQVQHISGRSERHHGSPNKERSQTRMQIMGEAGIDCRRANYADKRQEAREGNDTAFVALLGPMLDECVDGHNKESASEAQSTEQKQHLSKGQPVNGDHQGKQRHANGPERDQAILDFSRGKQSGSITSYSDANRQSG